MSVVKCGVNAFTMYLVTSHNKIIYHPFIPNFTLFLVYSVFSHIDRETIPNGLLFVH